MKKFILLAAVAISLAGCTAEDDYIDESVAVQISATIGGNSLTRASNSDWDRGDNIGVSMSGRYFNMKYSTQNGDGAFAGTAMFFKDKQEPVTLTAYYPYSGTEGQASPVVEAFTNAERQTASEQPRFDFLYAVKENVTGAAPNVNLKFQHRMSKLTLIFKNGMEGMDIVKNITSCRINGLIQEGTFNPVSGVCSAKAVSASVLSLVPIVKDGDKLLSLILFPQTVGKVTINLTDSENQEYSCELSFEENRLEAGKNYLYTIKVQRKEMKIDKFAIVNWNEKELKSEAVSD